MAGERVLIAAFSGRALAASARRAGLVPLVVDCFGDDDTRSAAEAMIALPARVQTGFRPRPLLDALSDLAARAPTPPLGLVLGSGFECNPRLIARLAERFPLLGTGAEATRRCKDPIAFHATLDALAIAHPETRATAPPDPPDDWLMKRIGGSGGLHIIPCPAAPRPDPRRYFQRRSPGIPVSLAAIAHADGLVSAGLTRQWPSPLPRRPFRYGGAVTLTDAALEARLMAIARPLATSLELVGLVSFDVLVDGETATLLEINARPGATLDVLDDADGWLFAAHLAAACGRPLPPRRARDSAPARASAVLYADRGPLTIRAIDWPPWMSDRPSAGTTILFRQPLTTIAAEAATAAAAEALCRERLEIAARMLYGPHLGKEAHQ